ncbi:polysaccharide pyruvyl transferase family protein [Paucibacter sp. M5-1]|uniref:polysaccharide pyruvyl transferase family protein n=1 Tax=Paucibacter sp. M5-1 TaxID=3015998 RepID=UPI0022B9302B|nr:polysaccharide pyruvyl transferase family protein [Paucibacter sp. M5-1]MCZ7883033.1 hypothetical protein [Paucibacter sp. M5-1]
MKRRDLIHALAALGLTSVPLSSLASAKAPHILWRNAWNTNNIGDIGHVPGALALLRRYIPEARITLWVHKDLVIRGEIARLGRVADGALDAGTIHRRVFPDLEIVSGEIDASGATSNAALEAAVASADVMVIGSGAGILEPAALLSFHRRTGRPIGMFGITTDSFNFTYFNDGERSADVQALRAASFVFTRERTSLRLLGGADVDGPLGASVDDPATPVNETINRQALSLDLSGVNADFVPDSTFAFDARDDARAAAFMKAQGLVSGKFICVVPRHRWTPTGTKTRQGDSREVYNALYLKADHDKLKTAIIDYLRAPGHGGHKVALVPETVYVVELLGLLLKEGLPEDVAARVVVRDSYWLPDEAASLFAQAQAVLSIENHSPIIAAAVGTPFLMVHQPEDSIKADMFRDIGLGDWYIPDINRASGADISAALMAILRDLPKARRRLARAMTGVQERHAFGMRYLRQVIGLPQR